MKTGFLKLFTLFTLATQSLTAQQITPFQEQDRVVFLGNSITDGGHYHSYIWLYYMTRYPDMNLRIMNAGIGGDTAYDMQKRLDGDVFSKQPTVLVVTFGMNDSGYFEYNGDNPAAFAEKKLSECYDNYQLMESRFKTLSDTRIILMGGSPYDETAQLPENQPLKGKNNTMINIVNFQKESARKNQWEFIDLNEPMTKINTHFQQSNPSFTICGDDRIHPDNDGHMVMAYLFLKGQGLSGKEIAHIEIDGAEGDIRQSINCELSDLKRTDREITFDYLAHSLPYPLDTVPRGWGSKKSQAEAIKIVPFIEEMNKEILKVTGLKGNYQLLIDNEEIGVWAAEELSKGINLATETKTPQYQQALSILYLNEYRWEIERNFRDYAWTQFGFFQQEGLLFADNRKAIEVMDKNLPENIWLGIHRDLYSKMMHPAVREARTQEMELLINKIYEINKPLKRKITLRKIG